MTLNWTEALGAEAMALWHRTCAREAWSLTGRHGLVEALAASLGALDAESLCHSAGGSTHVWRHSAEGRHSTQSVPPAAAASLTAGGATLYIPEHMRLAPACRALESTLDLPGGRASGAVFVQSAGAHTVRHFDPVDLLVVQLSGDKTWSLGPNTELPDPLMSCAENDLPATRLGWYSELPDGEALHEGWTPTTHRLSAGSVLFVPRGFWHATETHGAGVSVHFPLRSPTWVETTADLLSLALVRYLPWRQVVWGPGGVRSRQDAESRLAHLRAVVDGLTPDDLLPRVSTKTADCTHFVRRRLATLRGTPLREGVWRVRVTALGHPDDHVTDLEVDELGWAVCRHLRKLEPGQGIRLQELCAASPSLGAEHTLAIARHLASAGLLRPAP